MYCTPKYVEFREHLTPNFLENLATMPNSFGKCILLTIQSIPNLVTYFQNVLPQGGERL